MDAHRSLVGRMCSLYDPYWILGQGSAEMALWGGRAEQCQRPHGAAQAAGCSTRFGGCGVRMSEQDQLTRSFFALFLGIFAVAVSLFGIWAGRKTLAGRFPRSQITGALYLFAGSMIGMTLGLNLTNSVQADWGLVAGAVCAQIGGFLGCISCSWMGFLDLRYPLHPSSLLNDPWQVDLGRKVAAESALVGLTLWYATSGVLYWTSGAILAIGVGAAAFVLVYCIAALLLNRMVRHRGTDG